MLGKYINDTELITLHNQGLTDIEIADILQMSYITVGGHRRKLGLKANIKKNYNKPRKDINKELLVDLSSKYNTYSEMARVLNCSVTTIKKWFKDYNIPFVNKKINPVINLTHIQKEVIFGTILGDTYCKRVGDDVHSMLMIQHSLKQKDYVEYLNSFLSNLPVKKYEYPRPDIRTGKIYQTYTHSYYSNVCFDEFRDMFYIGRVKHIPVKFLKEYYTPLAMAIHYMDDGSLCYKKNKDGTRSKNGTLSIATCSFSKEELQIMADFIEKTYGLHFIVACGNRLRLSSKDILKFVELVKPYICESMLYKIDVS